MILSNLWMTLQKIEAAGHGDYIVNFAGALCFTERTLAVIEENLFNTRAVGIKMGVEFGDTVSVFCSRIEAFVKLHPSAADLYVMTINNTERNSIAYISVCSLIHNVLYCAYTHLLQQTFLFSFLSIIYPSRYFPCSLNQNPYLSTSSRHSPCSLNHICQANSS